MNIWHINPYDTIPGESWRPGRAITMCQLLSEHGHKVTWWTSNYSHFFKKHRSQGWSQIVVNSKLEINLVPVHGYRKHVGYDRLLFHWDFATRLYQHVTDEKNTQNQPDVIIWGCPSPGADIVSVKLAKRFQAKLVIDVRDLWPELFELAFPKIVNFLAPLFMLPFYSLRRYAFKNAYAMTAVTNTYLDVALKESENGKLKKSKVIYFGADVYELKTMIANAQNENNITKRKDDLWVIYAGTIGDMYDFPTLMHVAKLLSKEKANIRFIIAGDGPQKEFVLNYVKNNQLKNVTYLGILSLSQLAYYYRESDIGLSPYRTSSTVVMPAKIFDYFAAGLPVLNSLGGELEQFLKQNRIGLQYISGDEESLYSGLIALATNGNLREEMGNNALSISGQFDRSEQYLKFLELL